MLNIHPALQLDAYKLDHARQYPTNTTMVFNNFTPRGSRIPDINKVVHFGLQYFIKEYLINQWNENFFNLSKREVVSSYRRLVDNYIGPEAVPVNKIAELHEIGYLPIEISAIPEGFRVPLRVPMFIMHNTLPEAFWLPNALETAISNSVWMGCTSATTAFEYLKTFHEYSRLTGIDDSFIKFQGHDFSYRGMSSLESACISGAAHLLSFVGTDTIPAILWLEKYYRANVDNQLVGCSVAATEHSTQCLATFVLGSFDNVEEEWDEQNQQWIPIRYF